MKLLYVLVFGLICFQAHAEVTIRSLSLGAVISENRETLDVWIENKSDYDVFCSQLSLLTEYEDPSGYVSVSQALLTLKDIFIRGGKDAKKESYSIGADEYANLQELNKSEAVIRKVIVSESNSTCKRATFLDWAYHAEHYQVEKDTLAILKNKFKVRDYKSLNKKLVRLTHLNLNHSKLASVRALRYFPNIKKLDLRNNNIRNVWPLKDITNLKKLSLRENPVTSVWDLRYHENLSELNIRETQIDSLEGMSEMVNLWWLDAKDIPINSLSGVLKSTYLVCLRYPETHIRNRQEVAAWEQIQKRNHSVNHRLTMCLF